MDLNLNLKVQLATARVKPRSHFLIQLSKCLNLIWEGFGPEAGSINESFDYKIESLFSKYQGICILENEFGHPFDILVIFER